MNKKLLFKILIMILLIVPIFIFFWNVFQTSVNIPNNDDYPTVLNFLMDYLKTHSIKDKFDLIIAKWNEHRQPFNKLVTLALYYLNGSIDIRQMIFVGNIGLLFIAWTLYLSFKPEKDKLLLFIPAMFLFFQPMYSENIFFGMASLTNFYIMSFGFLSLYLIASDKKGIGWFIPAVILGVISYYTQRNGLLILQVGVLMLAYKKEYRKLAAWGGITILAFLFFTYYTPGAAAVAAGKKSLLSGIISFDIRKIADYIVFYFTFIGNYFGANYASDMIKENKIIYHITMIIPVLAGVLINAYFIFLTVTKYYKKNLLIYSLFLFLFMTAAGAAVGRGNYGLEYALLSRYRVVTILFYILTYFSIMEMLPEGKAKKTATVVFLCGSILFNAAVYKVKEKSILKDREKRMLALETWKKTGKGLEEISLPYINANEIMKNAVEKGIYKVPEYRK